MYTAPEAAYKVASSWGNGGRVAMTGSSWGNGGRVAMTANQTINSEDVQFSQAREREREGERERVLLPVRIKIYQEYLTGNTVSTTSGNMTRFLLPMKPEV